MHHYIWKGQYISHPDGVIKFETGEVTDQQVKEELNNFKEDNPNYIGTSCNCSDFAASALESATGIKITGEDVGNGYNKINTPNGVFRQAEKQKGAKVLKHPGDHVYKPFNETAPWFVRKKKLTNEKKKYILFVS